MYMLLVSAPSARFLLKAPLREVQLHARIIAAENPMWKLAAPPIEERSFAKLTHNQLLHIAYTFNEAPEGEYTALLQQVQKLVEDYPVNETSLKALEADVKRLAIPEAVLEGERPVAADPAPPKVKKERLSKDPSGVPNPESSTGRVWAVAAGLLQSLGRLPTSKEVMVACEAVGIKAGTASVQYSKWKVHQSS